MRTRSLCPVAFAACLLATAPFAAAQESSVFAELAYGSKYVFRGLQYGEDTLHPSVEIARGDFYTGVWAALPLEKRGWPENYEDEYDFYAGYGWALSPRAALDVGATYYYYSDSDATLEAYAGVTAELGTLSPALYVFRDFDRDAYTFELSTGFALPLQGFPAEASARIGRVEADWSRDYTYYGLDLIYPYHVNDMTKLSLGLHYADNDFGRGVPGSRIYGSAALALTF